MLRERVLIVEDQAVLREALMASADYLFTAGCIVEAHGNLKFLDDTDYCSQFDYAIIDPGLPGVSANDIHGRLKTTQTALDRLPTKCVKIVFTGNYTPQEGLQMLEIGADRYINKLDVDLVDLAAQIKSVSSEKQD